MLREVVARAHRGCGLGCWRRPALRPGQDVHLFGVRGSSSGRRVVTGRFLIGARSRARDGIERASAAGVFRPRHVLGRCHLPGFRSAACTPPFHYNARHARRVCEENDAVPCRCCG
jgi:hypothetical protein